MTNKSPTDQSIRFSVGERVEGNYNGQGRWFQATILDIYESGYVNIVYMDGDIETLVIDRIRKYHPLVEGDEVETYFRDCPSCALRWFNGVVLEAHPENSYSVRSPDGIVEYHISPVRIARR